LLAEKNQNLKRLTSEVADLTLRNNELSEQIKASQDGLLATSEKLQLKEGEVSKLQADLEQA